MTGCTLGVGCDEYGICYAEAHGQPEQCPRTAQAMAARSGETGTGSTEGNSAVRKDAPTPPPISPLQPTPPAEGGVKP